MEMQLVVDRTTFYHWGVAVVMLLAKVLFVSVSSGVFKTKAAVPAGPEDVKFTGGDKSKARFGMGNQDVERCYAALRNDFEQVYPFIFVSGLVVLLNESTIFGRPIFPLFYVYVTARWLHTLCYVVLGVQPWRTLSFILGTSMYMTLTAKLISALLLLHSTP
mmetsp:Transcript_5033/g.10658  ORF Transcript_5033/g.10658 Transcript_5033/m.10658 type:complete len:162 (+) Transcript_5033:131-616(+)|eukprot:CAMPEP_0185847338 /NCGR_PEP_ID=MMETSP1354-20130828/2644_1 /TAXON_ID=708628 /ORGANISM="Erythrolobus madagascarensis, Strain CCMP3276" /LENGTH=161 /DNA_ID=CAMNT_0028547617 /DNA_START=61 /DNA_END=546 /DNA_ORIENTATION=-